MKETCNIIIGLRKQNAVCLRHKIQNHEKHCNHLSMRIGVLLRGNLSSYSILTRIITNISDFEIQIEKKIASASIVSAEQSSQIKDVDGDCTSEIIVSRFIPSKPLISNRILIYDGNLNIKYSILVAFHFTFAQNNFVLLDIDSDGFSEIIIQAADITENPTLQQGHLICYDLNGNIKWIAAEKSILGSNVFF